MSTYKRPSFFYRGVPDAWTPIGFTCTRLKFQEFGRPGHNGQWHVHTSCKAQTLGPWYYFPAMVSDLSTRTLTRQPVGQLNKGPWGMVEYQNPPDTGLWGPLGLVQDMLQTALHAIANQFPKKYQAQVALIVELVAAAWSAGALSGLLVQTFSALDTVIAKKLAGDLVSKVMDPRLALKAVTAPPLPPNADLTTMGKKLMGPLEGMAARSAKGDPADGLGKALSDAARAAATASNPHDLAKAKQDLQTATTALGQLQTNLAILVTLAFTNELRANLWGPTPVKFSGGWSPDQWFQWVQSLPMRPHYINKNLGHPILWTYRSRAKMPTPYGPPPNGNDPMASSAYRVQMAKTARRDALRAYFKGAGFPVKAADWIQAMIEASPEAKKKIQSKEPLTNVIVTATRDAVQRAAKAHAKAFKLPAAQALEQPATSTPAPAPASSSSTPPARHKSGQLAPLLAGATLLVKVSLT